MSERWGCRISRVRPHGTQLTMVVTPPAPEANGATDSFIETLVWVLGRARRGQVQSYALVFNVENPDGGSSMVQAADVAHMNGADRLVLLGAIQFMQDDLTRRVFSDRNEGRPDMGGDGA